MKYFKFEFKEPLYITPEYKREEIQKLILEGKDVYCVDKLKNIVLKLKEVTLEVFLKVTGDETRRFYFYYIEEVEEQETEENKE